MHRHTHLPSPYPFGKPEATLHVLCTYFNPVRFHSRARLFSEFVARMEATPHVKLWIVEVAFGERPFEMTDPCNPKHLQLRTFDELWHKEAALNALAKRLPHDWKYVAWVDGDVAFDSNPLGWAMEAIHALQHHNVVQLWDRCLDLDIRGNPMHTHRGAVSSWKACLPFARQYGHWHPGYAWAFTRAGWNGCGGLFDYAILGAGDDHMMKGLLGRDPSDSVPRGMHPNYLALVTAWCERARDTIKLDIGYLQTTLKHFYHGSKEDRRYWGRWEILKGCSESNCQGVHCPNRAAHLPMFDPLSDIKRDWQGLWQLTDRKRHIRDGIRQYMSQRNEDANH